MRYINPDTIDQKDIKHIRAVLGMTQKEFAELLNVSPRTVEAWERPGKKISGMITFIYTMLMNNPDIAEKLQVPDKKMPVRLWYMKGSYTCTIIDVDEMAEKVRIKNFVTHISDKAFGSNAEPTYEDYQEFLKSRCFPETRDKIKWELERLNIPFYDPFMIIQKTEGRMAEDDYWIRIELSH